MSFEYRVAFYIFSVIILCFSFVNHKNQNNGCRVIYQLRVHLHGRVKKAWPLASSMFHGLHERFRGFVSCNSTHTSHATQFQWRCLLLPYDAYYLCNLGPMDVCVRFVHVPVIIDKSVFEACSRMRYKRSYVQVSEARRSMNIGWWSRVEIVNLDSRFYSFGVNNCRQGWNGDELSVVLVSRHGTRFCSIWLLQAKSFRWVMLLVARTNAMLLGWGCYWKHVMVQIFCACVILKKRLIQHWITCQSSVRLQTVPSVRIVLRLFAIMLGWCEC